MASSFINNSAQCKLFEGLNKQNPFFRRFKTVKEMWNDSLSLVEKIENEISHNTNIVYDIITKVKIEKPTSLRYNIDKSVYEYQIVLAKVYCLLYYLHKDDPLYGQAVILPLTKAIDNFGNNWLQDIKTKIDEILDDDKKIAKIEKEMEMKKAKELFEVPNPIFKDAPERNCLFLEFNKESLFRAMTPVVEHYSSAFYNADVVIVWFHAKKYVKELLTLPFPETHINNMNYALIRTSGHAFYFPLIAQCILAIFISMGVEEKYKKLVLKLKKVDRNHVFDERPYVTDEGKSYNLNTDIPLLLKDFKVTNDYDYFEGISIGSSSNAEVEAITNTYENKLREQKKAFEEEKSQYEEKIKTLTERNATSEEKINTMTDKIASLEQQINELTEQQPQDQEMANEELSPEELEELFSQKVRMEAICQLLIPHNYNYTKKRGNQSKAARLISKITDINFKICNNYISERVNNKPVNEDYHYEALKEMKKLFNDMGIEWNL